MGTNRHRHPSPMALEAVLEAELSSRQVAGAPCSEALLPCGATRMGAPWLCRVARFGPQYIACASCTRTPKTS